MTETANTGTAPERIDLPGGWTLVLSDSFRTWRIIDARGHDHGHRYIDTSEALAALSSPASDRGEIERLEAEVARLRAELAEARVPEELRRLSEKATPGKWCRKGETTSRIATVGDQRTIAITGGWEVPHKRDDGAGDQAMTVAAVNFVRSRLAAEDRAQGDTR